MVEEEGGGGGRGLCFTPETRLRTNFLIPVFSSCVAKKETKNVLAILPGYLSFECFGVFTAVGRI